MSIFGEGAIHMLKEKPYEALGGPL